MNNFNARSNAVYLGRNDQTVMMQKNVMIGDTSYAIAGDAALYVKGKGKLDSLRINHRFTHYNNNALVVETDKIQANNEDLVIIRSNGSGGTGGGNNLYQSYFASWHPNIAAGTKMQWWIGKERSLYNGMNFDYHHTADGSGDNYLAISSYGVANIARFTADGQTEIGKLKITNVLNLPASTPPASSTDPSGTDGDLKRDATGNLYLKAGGQWLKFTGTTF